MDAALVPWEQYIYICFFFLLALVVYHVIMLIMKKKVSLIPTLCSMLFAGYINTQLSIILYDLVESYYYPSNGFAGLAELGNYGLIVVLLVLCFISFWNRTKSSGHATAK